MVERKNKIIDSHLHLLKIENYNLDLFKKNNMYIPENTPIDFLINALKKLHVSKAVIMGQKMERVWDSECGEKYVLQSYEENRELFIPLISIEPIDRTGKIDREELNRLKGINENKIRGLLLTPPYGQYKSNDRQVYPFYEIAQEKKLIVQYHHSANTGEKLIFAHHKYANMSYLNDVLVDFPNLKIVVEHLGYPWTEELFTLMATTDNLYTDLALLYNQPSLTAWKLVMAKEYQVIDKIMYGSDYYSYDENVYENMKSYVDYIQYGVNSVCKKSGWTELKADEIDGILYHNAASLYGI